MNNKSILQRASTGIIRTQTYQKIQHSLRHISRYALHWYLLIGVAILLVLVTLIGAGIAVHISQENGTPIKKVVLVPIVKIEDIQKAIKIVQARNIQYQQLLKSTPQVVDPGR